MSLILTLKGFYYSGRRYYTTHSTDKKLNEEIQLIKSLDNINHKNINGEDKTVQYGTLTAGFYRL